MITLRQIKQAVADEFGMTPEDLESPSREDKYAVPRHYAMLLCVELTDYTYGQIGAAFGNRNHATVIAGVDRAAGRRQTAQWAEAARRKLLDG